MNATTDFYQPRSTVTGPAYTPGFKLIAGLVMTALAFYGVRVFSMIAFDQIALNMQIALLTAVVLLVMSYLKFLKATTTVDLKGIRQTGLLNKELAWPAVKGAKLVGLSSLAWLFPPRLLVYSGKSFTVFHGGSKELLAEFDVISRSYKVLR